MFTHLTLHNWKNFKKVDVELQRRMYLVGPNASGKSNFLDVFRFLRELAEPGGGLQPAVEESRRGLSRIRSLHARQRSAVSVDVSVELTSSGKWQYQLEIIQDNNRVPTVKREAIFYKGTLIRERPTPDDRSDPALLRQTHIEQVSANKEFRELADFLASIRYLHVVPQLIRDPARSIGYKQDPYGGDFLEQIVSSPKKTKESRLRKIESALKVAVPQLRDLRIGRDAKGVPHLEGLYKHWRPNAGRQQEDEFSDGTLRLLGVLWAILDGTSPLLLEEPELSLHPGVVQQLPQLIARLVRKSGRQVFISTHSSEMLTDKGIPAESILLMCPGDEGTEIVTAAKRKEIRAQLEAGITPAAAVLPFTSPRNAGQLALFDS